jgi:acetoin:2,6-dichlorophenolindophenol oxidoreductase subunit alpha
MPDVVMPNMGFDTQSGRLIEWQKQPGDTVKKGDVIAIIESDKANVELEATVSGVLLEHVAKPGDEVVVGAVLARVGEGSAAKSVAPPMPVTPAPPLPVSPKAPPRSRRTPPPSEVVRAGDGAALDLTARQTALHRMLEIRLAEERIQELFLQNLIRGTTHLAIGQEACAVGTAAALRPGDKVTCTYRGHHHAVALGMSLRAMIAEMMGKAAGACKGKGGSMHMTDARIGLLGANAIVGAQLPIALGAALTAQIKRTGGIAVAFFGEGASNIGAFHEALNMAAAWSLPVLFICENNLYGEYSVWSKTTPVQDIAVRAAAYAMPGVIVDGQDAEAVYNVVKAAGDRARAGEGPSLIECKTYRYRGHSRTDTAPYRKPGELDEWLKRDPITILKTRMIADGQLDEDEFAEMSHAAEVAVADAVEWATAAPFPPIEDLYKDVYFEG